MVGFDLPHVANDMMMRFMDVNPDEVLGSIGLPSRLGDDVRTGNMADLVNGGKGDDHGASKVNELDGEFTFFFFFCLSRLVHD